MNNILRKKIFLLITKYYEFFDINMLHMLYLSINLYNKLLLNPTYSRQYNQNRNNQNRSNRVLNIFQYYHLQKYINRISNQLSIQGMNERIPKSIEYYKNAIDFGNNRAIAELLYILVKKNKHDDFVKFLFELAKDRIEKCADCMGMYAYILNMEYIDNIHIETQEVYRLSGKSAENGSLYGQLVIGNILFNNSFYDPYDDGIYVYEDDIYIRKYFFNHNNHNRSDYDYICKSKQREIALLIYLEIIEKYRYNSIISMWVEACMSAGKIYMLGQNLFNNRTIEWGYQKSFQLFMMVANSDNPDPNAFRYISEMICHGKCAKFNLNEIEIWENMMKNKQIRI